MRRSVALAGFVLAGTAVAPVAGADPGATCTYVNARMATTRQLTHNLAGVHANVGFSISGGCPVVGVFASAACGNAQGSGTLTAHGHSHAVDVTWIGDLLVFTGGAVGVLHVQSDVAGGRTCITGASGFLVNGTLVTN